MSERPLGDDFFFSSFFLLFGDFWFSFSFSGGLLGLLAGVKKFPRVILILDFFFVELGEDDGVSDFSGGWPASTGEGGSGGGGVFLSLGHCGPAFGSVTPWLDGCLCSGVGCDSAEIAVPEVDGWSSLPFCESAGGRGTADLDDCFGVACGAISTDVGGTAGGGV